MCDLAGQLMVRGKEARLIKLAASPAVPFLDLPWEEALDAFRERVPTRKNELERLLKAYAQRSEVARQLALLQIQDFVKRSLTTHIRDGGTYQDFARDIDDGKQTLGITANDPSYLKMVFRTNVQSAYGAGRFRAVTDPEVIEERPYVQYRTVGDARVRDSHAALDRGIYRADSEEWHRIAPPNSFNCRCSLVSLGRDEVGSEKILGQVPREYEATPEFDTAPMPAIKQGPANDNARELGGFRVALFNPLQKRAGDGKWSSGGFTSTGKSKGSLRRRVKAIADRKIRTKALKSAKSKYQAARAAHAADPTQANKKKLDSATGALAQRRRDVFAAQSERDKFESVAESHQTSPRPQSTAAERSEALKSAKQNRVRSPSGDAELKEERRRIGKSSAVREKAKVSLDAYYATDSKARGRVFGEGGAKTEAYNAALADLNDAGDTRRARDLVVEHNAGNTLSDLRLDMKTVGSRGEHSRVPPHTRLLNELAVARERDRRKAKSRKQ